MPKYFSAREVILSALAVMLITSSLTVLFIIWKHFSGRKRKKLCVIWVIAVLLLAETYICISWPDQKRNVQLFFTPEAQTDDYWSDGHNGVLMKELLSKAELLGAIPLDKQELMQYGTRAWYLEGEQLARRMKYLHPNQSDIVLEDIMPQHYKNNYQIAWWVLQYGWIPATLLLVLVAGFYISLFMAARSIHNPLGRVLVFSCSLCLVLQTMLYALGNFGYQYGTFCNFPILSEGFVSIAVNMILVGLVLSVYRYDTVICES